MPEVAGEAAILCDPNDPGDIAEKMHIIYKDEALRARLIAKAHIQVEKFNWDASAVRLWDCMMKCVPGNH
jgi:glycosyltransferase involved in cell wall biosynthesis